MAEMFPVRGARITDGHGIPPSVIPLWLAKIAFAQWTKHHGPNLSLAVLEQTGGFAPMQLLDLIAGGNGDGAQFRRVLSHRPGVIDLPVEIVKDSTDGIAKD